MRHRPTTTLIGLAALAALAGCDATASGAAHYRAGRFADSLAAFRDAETRAGDSASPELLFDHALAAVRSGEPAEADAAAGASAARGGAEFAALRDFLRGNSAYARAETAEFQADLPASPPGALDRAIAHAQTARDAWTQAETDRGDWPAAHRNAQRATILIDHLKARKAAAENGGDRAPGRRPNPKAVAGEKPSADSEAPPIPAPPRPQPTAPPAANAAGEPRVVPLTRAQVLALLDRVDAKEREKLDLRRARRSAQPSDVERDW